MTDHCSDCELEFQSECPRYGGKADCLSAENEVYKGTEYDSHTDTCYNMPVCPECGNPLFIEEEDVGKVVECGICHTRLTVPEEGWIRKYINDFTGQRIEEMPCGCGGTMKIMRVKYNGNWVTAGGQCEKCGMRFIV